VPLNDTLALAGPGGPAAEQWAAYAPRWSAGNHARAAGAIAAAAALVRALSG